MNMSPTSLVWLVIVVVLVVLGGWYFLSVAPAPAPAPTNPTNTPPTTSGDTNVNIDVTTAPTPTATRAWICGLPRRCTRLTPSTPARLFQHIATTPQTTRLTNVRWARAIPSPSLKLAPGAITTIHSQATSVR